MRPATKHCRSRLVALNEGYRGVVVALSPGCFHDIPVRYEIVEFKRWTHQVSNIDYCSVVLTCLTDADPRPFFVKAAVEGEVDEHSFSLDDIEELLIEGRLSIVSTVHAEDWYRPDQACLAV